VHRVDDLFDPDLVAPGHEIVGADATGAVRNIANLDDLARTHSAAYSPYGSTPRSSATRGCRCWAAGRRSPPTSRSANRA
jgi:hypothetical protein